MIAQICSAVKVAGRPFRGSSASRVAMSPLAGHPSPPPKKHRFPPNTKPPRRLPDANIVSGKQDNAGTLNKPLWRGARAHQALKNQPILVRYLYRFRR